MTLRLPWTILLLLSACGPGTQDTEDTATDTGSVSMSSSPSGDPSSPTLPTSLDPSSPDPSVATTAPPDPTAPQPTTATTTTTTTDPTTTADPSSFTVTTVPPSDTSFTDSSASDTEVFIVPFDLSDPGECDTFLEDCPQGSKCMPFALNSSAWNSTKCVPVMQDPAGVGEPCFVEDSGVSGVDNCEFHAMCFFVDPVTLQGACVAMCTGSQQDPVCAPDADCIIANDGVLTICLPHCDPLDIASCAPGQVCAPNDLNFICLNDASGDDGDFTDACQFINDCDPGFVCIDPTFVPQCDPDDDGCCSPFCDLTMPLCPPGVPCTPWFEEGNAPPSLQKIGVCADP